MYIIDRNMLHEVTQSELRQLWKDDRQPEIVCVSRAYEWVRRGNPHSTPLYVDMDGKVVEAKE